MKKRLCLLFAALVLICVAAVPVAAAKDNATVHIAGNTYYDPVEKAFLYYADSASMQAIRSNVADGMITEKAVAVRADAGIAMEVYLNGERLESISEGTFQTPGEYVVMYMGGAISERVFSFTIVPEACNYVNGYAMPQGFEITEAFLNDVAVAFEKDYIPFAAEGEYTVNYQCLKTEESYQLVLQTDFTGPVLALKEVTNGTAQGPVDISDAKEAAVVNILHNGEPISKKDVLTESGEYYIELADAAGNKTSYSFTILIYFDGNSWLFFLLVLCSCIGVIIYLMHSRKHLRVR